MIEVKKLDSNLISRANSNSFGGKRGYNTEHDYELYCNRVMEWEIPEKKKQKIIDKIHEKFSKIIKSRRKTPAFRHGDISRVLSSCIRHLRVV